MEQNMKRRKLLRNKHGGISAYAMIMLGMIIMLYMFGFTSMWSTYTGAEGTAEDNESAAGITKGSIEAGSDTPTADDYSEEKILITAPLTFGFSVLNALLSSVYASLLAGVTIAGILVFVWLFRNNSAIWQFIIPIVFMIVLNVFVFPISAIKGDMTAFDAAFENILGFSFFVLLLIFFNLFYILAVMEYVRGSGT